MIEDKHKDLVKECLGMLTDKAFYEESMAPCISGPIHGYLYPLGYSIFPCRRISYSDKGKALADVLTVYKETKVLIDDDTTITVYADEVLTPAEVDRLAEAWAHSFYEEKINEL